MNARERAINLMNILSDEQIEKLIQIAYILEFPKREEEPSEKVLTAMGALHKYANPEMIPFESEAFEKAIIERYIEKYGNNNI